MAKSRPWRDDAILMLFNREYTPKVLGKMFNMQPKSVSRAVMRARDRRNGLIIERVHNRKLDK